MNETKTYVLLSRCLLEKKIFRNEKWLKVFIWCILKARHQPEPEKVGGVEIKRGQFLFGRESASKQLNIKENTIYFIMKNLQKLNAISIKSNNKYSIVTVVNYNTYQDFKNYGSKPTQNQLKTNSKPTNTNNTLKECIKNDKEIINPLTPLKEKLIIPDNCFCGTLSESIHEWIRYRKNIKKPLKQTQLDKQVAWLEKQPEPAECIDQSIRNGWTGLFELKGGARNGNRRHITETDPQEIARGIDRLHRSRITTDS